MNLSPGIRFLNFFPPTRGMDTLMRSSRSESIARLPGPAADFVPSPGFPDSGPQKSGQSSPLLRFDQLEKRYGSVRALAQVQLSIERGSILALLGPNGAGKSTLFGCLLGLVCPSGGQIQFLGEPLTRVTRRRFAYLPERVALYPQRSVRENGLFFARLKDQPASELDRQLKRVGLAAVHDRLVRHLSKGMLQRLGLAITLCGQPEVLVLDEPFNGLDPALLDALQRILREEHERGATLLISTHTMSAIEPLATHVAILLEGRITLTARIEDLRASNAPGISLEQIYHHIARQNHAGNPEEILG